MKLELLCNRLSLVTPSVLLLIISDNNTNLISAPVPTNIHLTSAPSRCTESPVKLLPRHQKSIRERRAAPLDDEDGCDADDDDIWLASASIVVPQIQIYSSEQA